MPVAGDLSGPPALRPCRHGRGMVGGEEEVEGPEVLRVRRTEVHAAPQLEDVRPAASPLFSLPNGLYVEPRHALWRRTPLAPCRLLRLSPTFCCRASGQLRRKSTFDLSSASVDRKS
jgi:hypothetical protein